MPTRRRQVVFSMQEHELELMDEQAKKSRLTRSAYLRKLVVQDAMRPDPARTGTDAKQEDHDEA